MSLRLVPVSLDQANEHVAAWHRHNPPGWPAPWTPPGGGLPRTVDRYPQPEHNDKGGQPMRTMHPGPTTPAPQPPPAPVEWSSDHTARMATSIAADVAKIRKWVTFFGVIVIVWLCIMGLMLMTTIGALSDASS
jgi:hypothetical protein